MSTSYPPKKGRERTDGAKDGRGDRGSESLVEARAPAHLTELFFLLGREGLPRSRSGTVRIDLEADDAQVRCSKSDGASVLPASTGLESRVDAGSDDTRARYDLASEVAIGDELHMTGQLAYRDGVGRLLQLNVLLIDESALLMYDHVGIERAVFLLAFNGYAVLS